MADTVLTVTDIGTVVIAVSTVIYTVGTFLLWVATNKTTKILSEQVLYQISIALSTAHHNTLNAHRDIFLNIISNAELLQLLADDLNLSSEETRKKFLASILINHTLRIFLDYKNRLPYDKDIRSFSMDAGDLFSIKMVRERWDEVKEFHPISFVNYIDSQVLNKGKLP